jgi:hypothetical protein
MPAATRIIADLLKSIPIRVAAGIHPIRVPFYAEGLLSIIT